MKMKVEDYQELKTDITLLLHNYPNLFNVYMEKGLSQTRYRWDIFHAVNTKLNGLKYNKLYAYLSDDSIDTALKKITGTN